MKKDRSGIVHCFCMLKNNIVLHVCGYVTVTIFLLKTIKNGHRIDMSNIVCMSKKKKTTSLQVQIHHEYTTIKPWKS